MNKRILYLIVTFMISAGFSLPVIANTEALGTCLVDSLTGKERKKLAKWIYFAMAAHPDIKIYSKVTDDERLKTDKYIGSLITRLLSENCPSELKTAQKSDPLSIKKAFELVGRVAMQELLTNSSVTTAITNYVKYTDQNKINAVFVKK